MFPDASSLAQAACSAAYACGSDADWEEIQSLTAEIQHALDVSVPAQPRAAAEQGDDWGDWDDGDDVAGSSRPSIQDGDAGDLSTASLASQLATVSCTLADHLTSTSAPSQHCGDNEHPSSFQAFRTARRCSS